MTVPQGAPTVDGIACDPSKQVAYHIHAHLTVYVDGVLRPLAPGIGMVQPVARSNALGDFYGATSCYYWLHVRAQDGVIHIESPSPATTTLSSHEDIQIDVGTPAPPPQRVDWSRTGL